MGKITWIRKAQEAHESLSLLHGTAPLLDKSTAAIADERFSAFIVTYHVVYTQR